MSESSDKSSAIDDDWVESLLRTDSKEHDREYLRDDGFTARVMHAIPAPVALPAWRKPALVAIWGIAGAGIVAVLPDTLASVGFDALRALAAHRYSLQDIGILLLSFAGASWAGSLYVLRQDR